MFAKKPKKIEKDHRREMLIEKAHLLLDNIKDKDEENTDIKSFDALVDRVQTHEKWEKEKVESYHNYWSYLIIATPIIALTATAISFFIVGVEYQEHKAVGDFTVLVAVIVAGLEFVVTMFSALIGANLPAKRFSEAANNLIRLDELLFDAVHELNNEQMFPREIDNHDHNHDHKYNHNYRICRADFWKKKNKKLSEIGEAMISQGIVHQHHE